MRVRRRHHNGPTNLRHGLRAAKVAEAAWSRICEAAFGFSERLEGIPMETGRLPELEDESQLLAALGGTCIETIQPEDFSAAMTGDEILAWIERTCAVLH